MKVLKFGQEGGSIYEIPCDDESILKEIGVSTTDVNFQSPYISQANRLIQKKDHIFIVGSVGVDYYNWEKKEEIPERLASMKLVPVLDKNKNKSPEHFFGAPHTQINSIIFRNEVTGQEKSIKISDSQHHLPTGSFFLGIFDPKEPSREIKGTYYNPF